MHDTDDHPYDLISPAPPTWRERVLKLIEGATLDASDRILVNGEFRITTPVSGLVIKRGTDGVELKSMELFEAACKRRDELWREHKRAYDDANAEAIERILQPTTP